jgi:hypothetical protein
MRHRPTAADSGAAHRFELVLAQATWLLRGTSRSYGPPGTATTSAGRLLPLG